MGTFQSSKIGRAATACLLAAAVGCVQVPLSSSTAPPELAAAPPPSDCELARAKIVQAINEARASDRICGGSHMSAAPPLEWNLQLFWAAEQHARDMAWRDYFEHRSPAGDSVRERVRAQDYWWQHVGENLAGGTNTLDRTVQAWLESPSHCANLMRPDYEEMALACVKRPGTEFENYWTLVMARK